MIGAQIIRGSPWREGGSWEEGGGGIPYNNPHSLSPYLGSLMWGDSYARLERRWEALDAGREPEMEIIF